MKQIIAVLGVFGLFLTASPVFAQSVATKAQFFESDTDMAALTGFQMDFFQCTAAPTGTPPDCTTAGAPFQSGVVIPKANVTTLATPDCSVTPCNNREIALNQPPANGFLASTPIGVAFKATLIAKADPAVVGAVDSARSAASNPFTPHSQLTAAQHLILK